MTPAQAEAFAELNDREQRYAMAIISGASLREAAEHAFPGAKVCNTSVRHRPHVHRFLTLMQADYVNDAVMTRNEAMERLSAIARTSITDVVEMKKINWGTEEEPDIQTVWQLKDDPEALASVQKLSAGPSGPKVELYSALQAIKQMAEMAGWTIGANAEGALTVETDSSVIDVSSMSNETLHELVLNHYASRESSESS